MARRARCVVCGVSDKDALAKSVVLCHEDLALVRGLSPNHWHHLRGIKNGPDTMELPANVHAIITAKESRMPEALRNPGPNPLLKIARRNLTLQHFLQWYLKESTRDVSWIVALALQLQKKYGPEWWKDMDLAPLDPEDPR